MHDGFHPHLLLDEQRKRLIAHARRSPRTIGDVDAINAHRLQVTSAFDLLAGVNALGRNDLHHGDELAVGHPGTQARALPQLRHFDLMCSHRLRRDLEAAATRLAHPQG